MTLIWKYMKNHKGCRKKNYYPLFAIPCNTDGGVGDLSAADALIVITVLNKSLFLILTILKGKLLPRALSCCQIFSKISAAAGEAGTAFTARAVISSAVEHTLTCRGPT